MPNPVAVGKCALVRNVEAGHNAKTMSHASARPVRPRRSVLYVPASSARAMQKAAALDADAIIYDLEDSVAPGEKRAAREQLRDVFAGMPKALDSRPERIIRINALSTEEGGEDILAARFCKPDAILLPKVEDIEDLSVAAEALEQSDAPETMRIWAMIETPQGVLNAARLAMAARTPSFRLDCFVIGTNDLLKETGVQPQAGRPFLVPWLMQTVLAARAYGLDVLDGVYNDFRDEAGFGAECAQGRAMGFDGKTLIHPSQIDAANHAFGIGEAELAAANAIRDAFALPENAGRGVISIDGRMVERLHLDSAVKTIEKAHSALRRSAMTGGLAG